MTDEAARIPRRGETSGPGDSSQDRGRLLSRSELEAVVANRTEQLMRAIKKSRQEIRERRALERHDQVYAGVLRLFHDAASRQEYLERAARLLRQGIGCQCLGVRVLDGKADVQYIWQEGFPPAFVHTRRDLSINSDGCICPRVATGRFLKWDKPAVTPAGSFLTRDLPQFYARLPEDARLSYCGDCLKAGFRTLGIAPIRSRDGPIGIIHMADERKRAIPGGRLRLLESIAPLIGEALYRFQVEEELRISEARLAEVQRIAHIGSWDWNIQTGEAAWSEETRHMFGVTSALKPDYDAFISFVHPDDRERVKQALDAARHEGKPYDLDYRILLPQGVVRVLHGRGEVSCDAAGKPMRMLGTIHDITERKGAEDQLRNLSRRLVQVQEEERRCIARELHDQVGQSLTMLGISIQRSMTCPPEQRTAILADAKKLVKEMVGQVREMSLNLRPSILDDLGLLPALIWHFERYTERSGIKVTFQHSGLNILMPTDVRTTAYRVVQEALNNVAKHAGPCFVDVRATVKDGVLSIQVEDSGVGFSPRAIRPTSTGINGMEERARLVGGSLAVDSVKGLGTCVTLELPLIPTPPPTSPDA